MEPVHRLTLRLCFPCELAAVRPAVLQVRAFLVQQGLGEEETGACELALAEACNNAVQYATGAYRDQPICVEALVDGTSIELRVEDHTPEFELPEGNGIPDPYEESGRGVYLMRSLMEEVNCLRGHDGNCLVLRRRRAHFVANDPAMMTMAELQRRQMEEDRIIRDMADELSSCYESLSAIFRYGAEQTSDVNIRDFAHRLLQDLLRITGAGWYVLRLVSEADGQVAVFTASEPEFSLEPLSIPKEQDQDPPTAVELRAIHSRRDAWFDQGSPLAENDPLLAVKRGAVGLVHPVYFGESLMGTLAVGGDARGFNLTAARTNVIHTFGDFLAIQIVNSRYQESRVSSLLVARELEIARHIQRSLLVKLLPEMPGVGLAGYCESASQVGGDFFDVIRVSDSGMLLLISDVMGKGIPAAMFAVIMRSLVRASLALAPRPAELLAQVNRLLYEELNNVEMFITAQLVYLDMVGRRLIVANAGHCPMLIVRRDTGELLSIAPEGIPLGVLAEPEYMEEVVPLESHMRALLYTDGLTESCDPEGEHFGQRRLAEWLVSSTDPGQSAGQMKDELLRRLRAFRGDHALPDDQTFMIITLTGSRPDEDSRC
jgi:serine phosphatase RsbU (regulator of sigma subunit)/anti-sigma regulatory factor (Ser/Thr protein kinase)